MANDQMKKKEKLKISPITEILYTIIGSSPVLIIIGICSYLIHNDYVLNNKSFWEQSTFVGNTVSNTYFQNLACPEYMDDNDRTRCGKKMCARSFNDFLVTEVEAAALLK